MPLQAFSFPLPETRFFKAGSFIYKFTIRGGSSYRQGSVIHSEIIRTVLGNLDDLQPFSSTHYIIFPCILHLCIISAFKRLSSLNLTHYFSTYATKLI
uniref:Uncharacterized protein n=2 Tax=Haplochromini TaxID=319058 RepID=A0A3B4H3J3_9CICH